MRLRVSKRCNRNIVRAGKNVVAAKCAAKAKKGDRVRCKDLSSEWSAKEAREFGEGGFEANDMWLLGMCVVYVLRCV